MGSAIATAATAAAMEVPRCRTLHHSILPLRTLGVVAGAALSRMVSAATSHFD